jgi:hypothetical protein
MPRFILSIFFIGMLSVPVLAQIQPGSTGGSIGKTDKSISGGESGEPRTPVKSRSKRQQPANTSARSKIFNNPTINGIRVDRCMKWGPEDCGAPAANHWCQSKGFARATDWSVEKVHPTIFQDPQSPHKVCDYFFCDAFTRIACE